MTGEEMNGTPGTPLYDPSARTLDTLEREIGHLEEKTAASFESREKLTTQAFQSVAEKFSAIECSRIEQKADTAAAVAAALQAAKEAVAEQTLSSEKSISKSEGATSKQLEQQNATFTAALAGQTTMIADLKDRVALNDTEIKGRVTAVEATRRGVSETVDTRRKDTTAIYAAVTTFFAMIAILISLVAVFAK